VHKIGTAAGGHSLTLSNLDSMLDAVQGTPSAIICNKTMRRTINGLMRSAGQATEEIKDDFGRLINYYAGIPICLMDVDNAFNQILAFDEDDTQSTPASAECTSIYAVRFGPDGVYGIQAAPPLVDDQGRIGVSRQVLIDHYVNIMISNPKAIARLHGIKAI